MALNDRYTQSSTGVTTSGNAIFDASGTGTGVVQITELGGTGSANVKREIDEGQTGTFEISHEIASPTDANNPTSGNWHSQDNDLWIGNDGANNEVRIKVENASSGAQDYYAIGFETGTN